MSKFEVGQRVRVISAGDDNYPAEDGDIGTVVEAMLSSDLVLVDIDGKSERVWLFSDRLEKIEVTEGTNDDDSLVGEVPSVRLTAEGLIISGPLSFTATDDTVDAVNHPPHYKFSNGAEVIDITENLTFNGGNAVKYLARSTRQDGQNKGNVLEDLRKSLWYVQREIERVERVENEG